MKKTTRKVLNVISIIMAVAAIVLVIVSFVFDNSKLLPIALGVVVLAQFFTQLILRATKKEVENLNK
ncbi:MAG: hypothetical protein J6040_07760 [Clostridiales bacterium]|nr:hypothetical protein [Clostridiales bacterium]MBP5493007.1 hypothetical protein [Clostridiales bacterium]